MPKYFIIGALELDILSFNVIRNASAKHFRYKMDIKEFINNFANQFDDTDASVFTPETHFHDLDEWSSLMALSIIGMVDEEYDVLLRGDDIHKAVTVSDLFETIKSKAE